MAQAIVRSTILLGSLSLLCSCREPASKKDSLSGRHNTPLDQVHRNSFIPAAMRSSRQRQEISEFEKILLHSQKTSSEALRFLIRDLLVKDENETLRLLAQTTAEVDYASIEQAILTHFKGSEICDSLDSFLIIEKNTTLSKPLLARWALTSWRENPDQTFTWLCTHPDIAGIENAMFVIGEQFGSPAKTQEQLRLVMQSDFSNQTCSAYLEGAIGKWITKDLEKALSFVNTLPKGEVMDLTVYKIASQVAVLNPQIAIEWANSIFDNELRKSSLHEVTDQWKVSDLPGYLRWRNSQSDSSWGGAFD